MEQSSQFNLIWNSLDNWWWWWRAEQKFLQSNFRETHFRSLSPHSWRAENINIFFCGRRRDWKNEEWFKARFDGNAIRYVHVNDDFNTLHQEIKTSILRNQFNEKRWYEIRSLVTRVNRAWIIQQCFTYTPALHLEQWLIFHCLVDTKKCYLSYLPENWIRSSISASSSF